MQVFDPGHWLEEQWPGASFHRPVIDCDGRGLPWLSSREWLITNGLGSYASSDLCGANSRRYHGLFVAALDPPVKRTVLLSRLDETVYPADGEDNDALIDSQAIELPAKSAVRPPAKSAVELSTNYWQSGAVHPRGYLRLRAFAPYPVPSWFFELDAGMLVKQVGMLDGEQCTYIGYSWWPLNGAGRTEVGLRLSALVNFRDFHAETSGAEDWAFHQEPAGRRVRLCAYEGATEFFLQFNAGSYRCQSEWYWGYSWPMEKARGLRDKEDLYHAGVLQAKLKAGQFLTIRAGLAECDSLPEMFHVVKEAAQRRKRLIAGTGAVLERAGDRTDVEFPSAMKAIIAASDQFIVSRESTGEKTIIAGYHWFSDWGRDSMISLPGLCLATGRDDEGKSILRTFSVYMSQGMLPNYFPDAGVEPEYNTVDATLWWAWAVQKYLDRVNDIEFVRELAPLFDGALDWHLRGTRHGIKVDARDALLSGGGRSVQLTWMDAKCGDYVVTPRSGKAVEINALWFNFLRTIGTIHAILAQSSEGSDRAYHQRRLKEIARLSERVKESFIKFWNPTRRCLYDVISENGDADASLRPNQLFAVSLPYRMLPLEMERAVIESIEKYLLTPYGLRSLEPNDARYCARYGKGLAIADQYHRDITYHQGTVWPWLLGAWCDARVNVYGRTEKNFDRIAQQLKPLLEHLHSDACIGSISEIFDADAPHRPAGTIAQAWSVAEIARVMSEHEELRERLCD